jgi:two-component system sensor histidine kinase VicK
VLHLFRYRIPGKYADQFKEAYSYINVRQVTILSSVLIAIAFGVRVTYLIYHEDLVNMPNLFLYQVLNGVQITGAALFIIISTFVLKSRSWTISARNILVTIFCIFLLTSSFTVGYLFSQFNPKNTLTVFLTGIVAVSIFFALEFKQIVLISVYIIFLFIAAMIIPNISSLQKMLNIIMSGVLSLFLFACSRYSYYIKAEQFVKVKQLEEKNMEVLMLNQQKSEILGFVAHDLRNPLNNIEALTKMLLDEEAHQDSAEMQLILTSTRQAKHIIDDLLEVAHNDKTPFFLQDTNIIDFINGVCSNWQKSLNKERTINFAPTEPTITVAVNPSKLTRVMDNLIGNSLKFSKSETPINIEVSKSGDKCIILITDFGIGIPSGVQKVLFDQFSKAGRPGLRGEKSIGLGLHISKQIIEQHGGALTVQSKENEGTTFKIEIPLNAT